MNSFNYSIIKISSFSLTAIGAFVFGSNIEHEVVSPLLGLAMLFVGIIMGSLLLNETRDNHAFTASQRKENR